MKIGVSLPLPPKPPAVLVDPAVLAREAEKLGFESFWVAEHQIAPAQVESYSPEFEGGQVPGFLDPIVALSRAAAATRIIKLGTGVLLPPEHDALRLAKALATLDLYSGGRLILGVGAGWLKEATAILGGDAHRPWTETREAVQVLKALWTEDVAEFHGSYYDFPPLRCFPKPAQKPHPPVYLGGKARNVLRWVVEWGDGYMPSRVTPEEIREARGRLDALALEAGRDPKSIAVMAYRQPQDRDLMRRFEEAGAERVVTYLPIVDTEKRALEELTIAAERVLR